MNNIRFYTTYFRINALLTKQITIEGETKTDSFYVELKFRSPRHQGSPCILSVATFAAVILYRAYPSYDLKAILFTNIPKDDTLKGYYLRPYLYDRYYTVLGRAFDLAPGDTLYVRFMIPILNGVRYKTFLIPKEETDFLPVVLNHDRFRSQDLLTSRISQLHISTTQINQFGGYEQRGNFPRTRCQRG